jgi:large subunit ribosomal protein L25
MAKKISFKADKRKTLGRAVKKLRKEGILPGNVYGKDLKSQALQVGLADFKKVYKQAGETGVVDLKISGSKNAWPVLIHNVQTDPVTSEFLHVDFHRVSLKEKVIATVPVELKGKAPGAESSKGILLTLMSELEVEALPTDLPESLELDITGLKKIDDVLRVKDIKVDRKKVEIKAEENQLVVKIEKPAKEEEEKPAVPETEAEAEGEEGVEKEVLRQAPAKGADRQGEEGEGAGEKEGTGGKKEAKKEEKESLVEAGKDKKSST